MIYEIESIFILGNISQQLLYLIHCLFVLQAVNASNGMHPKIDGTDTGSCIGESTTQEAVVVEGQVDLQHVNSQKGSNKTLDRINL